MRSVRSVTHSSQQHLFIPSILSSSATPAPIVLLNFKESLEM
uniref:Uncharacterized protein n=1 Tax=Parascaris univalens TaxID=6257 RepID=A0A915CGJ0_PARUN